MTKRCFIIFQILAVALMTVMATACISQIPTTKDWANGAIGSSINPLLEAARHPGSYISRSGGYIERYPLENGNTAYVAPISEGCLIHFEVNSNSIILGYRTEGDRCF